MCRGKPGAPAQWECVVGAADRYLRSVGDTNAGVEVLGDRKREWSGLEEDLHVEASAVMATYNRVSRLGWYYVVLSVLGVERRGVAVSMNYDVCLNFMRGEARTSENAGLTCHALFRPKLCGE